MDLTPIFHLRWLFLPGLQTLLNKFPCNLVPVGTEWALLLCKIGFVSFVLVPSLPVLIYTPHSTHNNSLTSISSTHLINASAICQQSPVSFDSMFARLEFSEEVEKQRKKDVEGRWTLIVELHELLIYSLWAWKSSSALQSEALHLGGCRLSRQANLIRFNFMQL